MMLERATSIGPPSLLEIAEEMVTVGAEDICDIRGCGCVSVMLAGVFGSPLASAPHGWHADPHEGGSTVLASNGIASKSRDRVSVVPCVHFEAWCDLL